jgi:hypothetical protein
MSIKVVDEQGVELPPEEPKEVGHPDTEVIADGQLLTQRVGQELFDLKPTEVSREKAKLNTLIDYAKTKTEDHSAEGLKWALRSLSLKLGTPPMGEKLIAYLTRYAYLDLESQKIEKEKGKYHAGNY